MIESVDKNKRPDPIPLASAKGVSLHEAPNGLIGAVVCFKDSDQFGDHKKTLDTIADVRQFHLTLGVFHRRHAAHQNSQARAVDPFDPTQIYYELFMTLPDNLSHLIMDGRCLRTAHQVPADTDNGNVSIDFFLN